MMKSPWRITFDTNPDICNLNCIMCEEHSPYRTTKRGKPRIMDFSIVEDVIASALSQNLKEIIPSTMGEPLLYHKMQEFIRLLRDNGLKLNLTTNGTFPIHGVDHWAEEILPIASDVKISINGTANLLNEAIMVGLDHELQLSNIRRFIEIRDEMCKNGATDATITLQVTFMQGNIMNLPNLINSALEISVDRVKGHHLWITWPQLEKQSVLLSEQSRRKWNDIVKLVKIIVIGKPLVLENFEQVPLDSSVSLLPIEWKCPYMGQEAWIAWDGTFNVCCSPNEKRQRFGPFGNVKDTDFMDLWTSSRYQTFTKIGGTHTICRGCNMRKPTKEVYQ